VTVFGRANHLGM